MKIHTRTWPDCDGLYFQGLDTCNICKGTGSIYTSGTRHGDLEFPWKREVCAAVGLVLLVVAFVALAVGLSR